MVLKICYMYPELSMRSASNSTNEMSKIKSSPNASLV